MASKGESSELQQIWLEEIHAHFLGPKPESKLRFDIIVGDRTHSYKIPKGGPAEWKGRILCSTYPSIRVDIKTKKGPLPSKLLVSINIVLNEIATSPIFKQDASNRIRVKLDFSGVKNASNTKDTTLMRDVKEAQETAGRESPILAKLKRFHGLIKAIQAVGAAVSDIHPAIRIAYSAVNLLIEACEARKECQKASSDLAEELDQFLSTDQRVPLLRERKETRLAVGRMLELIAEVADYIRNQTSPGVVDILLTREYSNEINDFKGKFERAMKSFQLSIELEIIKGVHSLELDNDMERLEKLNPAKKTHYSTGEGHTCMEGTRTNLLKKTLSSLCNADVTSDLVWLYGVAGSGKSSVANTVAELIEAKDDFELICLFCKRDDPELSKPARFFPTLAHHIGRCNASYRAALIDLLSKPEADGIATGDIRKQYRLLFEDLLPKVAEPQRAHIIVIDALDECGTPAEQNRLASYILSLVNSVPWIKIFITSRPEPEIRSVFSSLNSNYSMLDINEESETNTDIHLFVEMKLAQIKLPLSPDEIGTLVRQASGLFIWCSTLFKYMGASKNPRRDLRLFLSDAMKQEPLTQLYNLYDQILRSAVDMGNQKDVAALHAILGIIYVSAGNRPLSAEALSCLLRANERFIDEDAYSVQNMTRALHAILYEDASFHGAIRVCHPSLLDFIQSKLQNGSSINLRQAHEAVFKGCLATMHRELKFNICELDDSSLSNRDIPDLPQRILKFISEALQYSTMFWFSHLSESGVEPDDRDVVKTVLELFQTMEVFFWLEVLSLMNTVMHGVFILKSCNKYFSNSKSRDVVADLERFVTAFSEPIKESAPHIYLSALPWSPENSLTQKIMDAASLKNRALILGKEKSWEKSRWMKNTESGSIIQVFYSPDGQYVAAGSHGLVYILDPDTGSTVGEPLRIHSDQVRTVAFSPDSQLVASGSFDKTICIWDIKAGTLVGHLLVGHHVYSVTFSKDGKYIASGSADNIIRIWDKETGRTIKTLEGHTGIVRTVVFCRDGQLMSCSEDKTIRIWDVNTGAMEGRPLEGHTKWVVCADVSPDGQFIVSASEDMTVRIWDIQTRRAMGQPLEGHSDIVHSVAFSYDSQWIVSGSYDSTIRIWDVKTHVTIGEFKHRGIIFSVAFSPSGQNISSGSQDGTVRNWNVGVGAVADGQLQSHASNVNAVTFSPCGRRIISGSDDTTVQIWDTQTGASIGKPFMGHTGSVTTVAVSPNGRWIASGSSDETVRVWGIDIGKPCCELFQGYAGRIRSVAFSPDSQHVAFSPDDGTIRIRDVLTGVDVYEALKGHKKAVTSVAFYPNGQRIISGSLDGTICIWNLSTRTAVGEPLVDQLGVIWAVAVSVNGQLIAFGGGDKTIRIRNAQTGVAIGEPFKGHNSHVTSLAFSADSARIVSCSWDCTVRVWDVWTGVSLGIPFDASFPVNSVATSPNCERIASASVYLSIQIWDNRKPVGSSIQGVMDEYSSDSNFALWNSRCSRMDERDGWVRDEHDKLLFWIPYRHRWNFKKRMDVEICKHRTGAGTLKPELHLAKLYAYAGTRWTEVYESS